MLRQRQSHPGAIVPSGGKDTEGWPPESGTEGARPMRGGERYEMAEELRAGGRGAGRVETRWPFDSFRLAPGDGRKRPLKML